MLTCLTLVSLGLLASDSNMLNCFFSFLFCDLYFPHVIISKNIFFLILYLLLGQKQCSLLHWYLGNRDCWKNLQNKHLKKSDLQQDLNYTHYKPYAWISIQTFTHNFKSTATCKVYCISGHSPYNVTEFWKISPNVTFHASNIYNQNEKWKLSITFIALQCVVYTLNYQK